MVVNVVWIERDHLVRVDRFIKRHTAVYRRLHVAGHVYRPPWPILHAVIVRCPTPVEIKLARTEVGFGTIAGEDEPRVARIRMRVNIPAVAQTIALERPLSGA